MQEMLLHNSSEEETQMSMKTVISMFQEEIFLYFPLTRLMSVILLQRFMVTYGQVGNEFVD